MAKCISTDPEWAEFAMKRRQKREELNTPWPKKPYNYDNAPTNPVHGGKIWNPEEDGKS